MSGASLRRRLLVLLLASTGLVWLGTAAYSYFDTRHEIGELLDAHLAQSAGLLSAQIEIGALVPGSDDEESDEGLPEGIAPIHRYERRVAFQVWRDEQLLLRSASAPLEPLSAAGEGFSDVRHGDVAWRVFGRRDEAGRVVQVGERAQLRDGLAGELTEHLLHPLLVALPLLGVLIWIGVGRGLAPLAAVNRQLGERRPDHLVPLDPGSAPREVAPLVETLNGLFARVAVAMENERRFTADAAHELRTPMAALRAQAQVALGAADDAERRRAVGQVIAACDRAARLVDQLLTLARLDPRHAAASLVPLDLRPVVTEVLAELGERALRRGVDLSLEAEPTPLAGDRAMLAVLVRNLVDNAIRYTPAGGAVRVRVAPCGGGAGLEVVDNGPGVAEEARVHLGERFYRVLGNDEPGSGLGLSIAGRICELHGAALAFATGEAGRGLRVSVRFGPGAAAG